MSQVTPPLPAARKSGVPITINAVSKIFGEDGYTPFRALKPIDVTITEGEFISVVGASGCGKSTLMLMVAGLLKSSTGQITVNGRPVAEPITDVGIAFQDHLLLEFRTAFENVMLHADIRGLDRTVLEHRAKDLFKQLRLEHAMHKYPRQLSGGMRQRVSLIRTLVHEPSVLLMDEPCSALDPGSTLRIEDTISQLSKTMTIVIVTHNMQQAARVSDYTAFFLSDGGPGQMIEAGSTNEIFSRPKDQRTENYVTGRFG